MQDCWIVEVGYNYFCEDAVNTTCVFIGTEKECREVAAKMAKKYDFEKMYSNMFKHESPKLKGDAQYIKISRVQSELFEESIEQILEIYN